MSAFKNLLKSDTPTSTSNSGTLSGQGSHFARAGDKPTTVTGTEPQTVGASDNSASIPPASQAAATAGPEAGGQSHIGTTSATSATAETSGHKPFPSTLRTEDGSGTAAIGQTTTYSSRPLASGDPTPSVIDHGSRDPLTYKFPEHGHEGISGGVPAGSAAAAATQAFKNTQGEQMPGGYPTAGYENPYKASHPLDPRVDGGKLGSRVDSSTSTPAKATGLGTSIGSPETSTPSHALTSSHPASGPDYRHGPSDTAVAGAGAGLGAAGLGASKAVEHPSTTSTGSGPVPSSLTTTADPTDRSAAYSTSTGTHGLDNASSAATPSSSVPTAHSSTEPEQQGIAGKVLGALGLGGAAGAAASALGYGDKSSTSAVDDAPRDTTAAAVQPGQSTLETGPPKHYRRESIPTTAYPGGPSSPRAVAPPVGGTVGGTQTTQSEVPREPGVASFHDLTTTGSGSQAPPSAAPVSTAPTSTDHTSRNVAAGGVAAAAAGAGAYGLHEHNRQVPSASTTTEAPDAGILHGTGPSTAATGISAPSQSGPATSTLPDRTRDVAAPTYASNTTTAPTSRNVQAPIAAVAAAPSRYDGQDAVPSTSNTATHEPLKREEDHTTRNAALGAGAGTAVAGGAAYAVHEQSEKDAARRAAEQEKELARQREHEQKEAARAEKEHQKKIEEQEKHARKEAEKAEKEHQKEIEKEQKAARKEEEHHQKELEKEEKKHHKEAEKEDKEHQAALLAAEKREKARLLSEEEDRKRREREAAAGVGTAAFTGAGMTAHEKFETGQEPAHQEKEKKPSIFKRIFKRRKNKDTGVDEDYSTDDEEDKAAKSSVPTHHSDTKGRTVLGGATAGRASAEQPRDNVTGLAYDPSKDHEAARRLSREPGALDNTTATGRGTDSAPLGVGSAAATTAGTTDTRPIEPSTGMPYDPSKDPAAARRLEERELTSSTSGPTHSHAGTTATTGTTGTTGMTGAAGTAGTAGIGHSGEPHLPAAATEPFGVIGDHSR